MINKTPIQENQKKTNSQNKRKQPVNIKRGMSPVAAARLTAGNILETVLSFATYLYRSTE